MVKNIRHTGIVVKDLTKIIFFYTELLGLKIENEAEESGKYIDDILSLKNTKVKTVKMSVDDGSIIELLYFESHGQAHKFKNVYDMGYSHIAFTVNDLESEYERLRKKGVRFNSAPQISTDRKAKVVFCEDPEGNMIELVEEVNSE